MGFSRGVDGDLFPHNPLPTDGSSELFCDFLQATQDLHKAALSGFRVLGLRCSVAATVVLHEIASMNKMLAPARERLRFRLFRTQLQ